MNTNRTNYRVALDVLQHALSLFENETNCTHTLIITSQGIELAVANLRGSHSVSRRLDKMTRVQNEDQKR